MEFEDTKVIDTDKDHLWELVSDPEVLAMCVPGAKEVNKLSETRYEGVIERGLAGVSLSLEGEVEITELNEPDYLSAEVTGEDTRTNSRMDAVAEMEMSETDVGQTALDYRVDMDFTGRLASLGSRIVKRKISSDIDTFFVNVQERAEDEAEEAESAS